MPDKTEWVPPELCMTHNGVNVFHAYHDGDIDNGPERHWFTLNAAEDGHEFDIRHFDVPSVHRMRNDHPPYMTGERRNDPELKAQWAAWHEKVEPEMVKAALREILDADLVKLPEDPEDNVDPNGPTRYQAVLVEVRRKDGKPLSEVDARELVNHMIGVAEDDARDALRNDDPDDLGDDVKLIPKCEFSVGLL